MDETTKPVRRRTTGTDWEMVIETFRAACSDDPDADAARAYRASMLGSLTRGVRGVRT